LKSLLIECVLLLCACLLPFIANAQSYQPNWVDFNGDVVSYKDSGISQADTDEITISFWLRYEDQQSIDGKYLFYVEGTEGRIILVRVTGGTRLSVAMDSSSPGGPTIVNAVTDVGALTPGIDQHIYIHKAAGGNLIIRVEESSTLKPALIPDTVGLSSTTHIGIMGRGQFSAPRIAKGRITDLTMYDTTVARSEFRDSYGAPKRPPAGALIYFGGGQKAEDWNNGANQGSITDFSIGSFSGGSPAVADYPFYRPNWVSFDGYSSLVMTDTSGVTDLDAATLSIWVNLDAPLVADEIIFLAEDTDSGLPVLKLYQTASGSLIAHFADNAGTEIATLNYVDGLTPNTRQHIELHFSRNAATEMLLNGVSVATDNTTSALGMSAVDRISVMSDAFHARRSVGNIADLYFYSGIQPEGSFYLTKSLSVPNDGTQAMPPPGGALIGLGGVGIYSIDWLNVANNNTGSLPNFDSVADEFIDSGHNLGAIGIMDVTQVIGGMPKQKLTGEVVDNPYAGVTWPASATRVQLHDHWSVGGTPDAHERAMILRNDAQGYLHMPFMHYSGDMYSRYYHINMGSKYDSAFFEAAEVDSITETSPLIVSMTGTLPAQNNYIFINNASGMAELNRGFKVGAVAGSTVQLLEMNGSEIDASLWGIYMGGAKMFNNIDTNQPWSTIHEATEADSYIPWSAPSTRPPWLANRVMQFFNGVEERPPGGDHILRHFLTKYHQVNTDFTDLKSAVDAALAEGDFVSIAHPVNSINKYRGLNPSAVEIHNGFYFNRNEFGEGDITPYVPEVYANMLMNWERLLRLDHTVRAISTNDHYGYNAFGAYGALRLADTSISGKDESYVADSGKIEVFVADNTDPDQVEAAIRSGQFVAVVDLETIAVYPSNNFPAPVKNNYPKIQNIITTNGEIEIVTANPDGDSITWNVFSTGEDSAPAAYAKIDNGTSFIVTQAFLLNANSFLPTTSIQAVEINVDPSSDLNEISPESSDLILVGVLGMSQVTGDAIDFDATNIVPDTLKLGLGEAPNIATPQIADLDGDSNMDIVFTFRTDESGIFCDDAEIGLTGQTYSGAVFSGKDLITTTDCSGSVCHP
jgi:hypothetical protein